MASFEHNLAAYNGVEAALGGAGVQPNDIMAVRAIAVLEGVSGGPADVREDNMVLRLNAIDVGAGGAGGHLNTLDALNSIVVLKGGVGGHENDLDAINEWVDFAAAFSSAFRVGIARVAANTSTGNQVITITWAGGGSHTPTAIEIRMIRASVDATETDHLSYSNGAATSPSARWAIAGRAEHGVGTSSVNNYSTDIACVALINPTSDALVALADFVSFGPDTVTINWSTAPGTGWFVLVTAYAGTDAAVAGTVNPSGVDDGTVDVETLGEAANYVMCSSTDDGNKFVENITVSFLHSTGFFSFDGSTARNACAYLSSRDGRASSDKKVGWSNTKAAIVHRASDSLSSQAYDFSTHANGFTITTHIFSSNKDVALGYLALSLPSGAEAYVGSLTSRTTIGTQSETAPSFKPQALLLHSTHADVISTDTASSAEESTPDADSVCFGSALSGSEFGITIDDEDAASTMNTASRSDSKIATVTKQGGDVVAIQANLDSFDDNGFTLDYTTVDATARNWVFCAFKQ